MTPDFLNKIEECLLLAKSLLQRMNSSQESVEPDNFNCPDFVEPPQLNSYVTGGAEGPPFVKPWNPDVGLETGEVTQEFILSPEVYQMIRRYSIATNTPIEQVAQRIIPTSIEFLAGAAQFDSEEIAT